MADRTSDSAIESTIQVRHGWYDWHSQVQAMTLESLPEGEISWFGRV
jgi:hypothetical protein